ncbi:hypothetical protein EMCLV008L [Equine molluscum contagiosum-like virus]|nr:hypothetical protein EMCLV008L [Equine molluscum contagiosum-like virus]
MSSSVVAGDADASAGSRSMSFLHTAVSIPAPSSRAGYVDDVLSVRVDFASPTTLRCWAMSFDPTSTTLRGR